MEQRCCVICGTRYFPRVAGQKTCDKPCSQEAKRQRKLECAKRWRERKREVTVAATGVMERRKTAGEGKLPPDSASRERTLGWAERMRMKTF